MTTSPKQMLLELSYQGSDRNLKADVADWIARGWSWQAMADEIRKQTNITVSRESIRLWYKDQQETAA